MEHSEDDLFVKARKYEEKCGLIMLRKLAQMGIYKPSDLDKIKGYNHQDDTLTDYLNAHNISNEQAIKILSSYFFYKNRDERQSKSHSNSRVNHELLKKALRKAYNVQYKHTNKWRKQNHISVTTIMNRYSTAIGITNRAFRIAFKDYSKQQQDLGKIL